MSKQLIEYNGRKYKFNSEEFRKRLLPENCKQSLKERILEMLQQEDMTVTLETVKAWYYQNNSTTDIDNLKKAAQYLSIDVKTLLIETDEVLECISKANNISESLTLKASIANIRNWMITDPIDMPGYVKKEGLRGLLEPKGIHIIFLVNILMFCCMSIEASTEMSSLFLLLGIWWGRFCTVSYFKKEKKIYRIVSFIVRIIEVMLLASFIHQAYIGWFNL